MKVAGRFHPSKGSRITKACVGATAAFKLLFTMGYAALLLVTEL